MLIQIVHKGVPSTQVWSDTVSWSLDLEALANPLVLEVGLQLQGPGEVPREVEPEEQPAQAQRPVIC